MSLRRLGAALLTVAPLAFACSTDKPSSAPPSVREAPPADALRPLTSRDEARPFAAPDAPSSETLPAGHPPVGGAASGKAVAGTVSIAAPIASRSSATDVLYLIARSRATKAVVAVRREEGVSFPHPFALSPADAMVADQPFDGPFDITARLSKTGDALPAKGDLEGTASGVAEGSKTVSIVIEKVRE